MNIKTGRTPRGLISLESEDSRGVKFSIQESSSVDRAAWIGIDVPKLKIRASEIHLTHKQVKELLPVFSHYVKTGILPLNMDEINGNKKKFYYNVKSLFI